LLFLQAAPGDCMNRMEWYSTVGLTSHSIHYRSFPGRDWIGAWTIQW